MDDETNGVHLITSSSHSEKDKGTLHSKTVFKTQRLSKGNGE
ncbi:hypothetical protein [Alkalihalobacillus deserti]|nr:hypothetical protein [Alkalihalobacillus deserti]